MELHQRGTGHRAARTFSVSMPTIKRWLKRRRETGDVEPKPIPGRPSRKGSILKVWLPKHLASFLVGASMVASAISMIVRLRRAGRVERQQIKWLAYGGAVVVGAIFVAGVIANWSATIGTVIIAVALLGLPISTGIAIVRHRLYNIDVVINRTLVYGALTTILAVIYFSGVTATQAVFRAPTGQKQQPQLAIVISTLVIAALFNPLRRRIQAFTDRRF
jgi:hypothetical protein